MSKYLTFQELIDPKNLRGKLYLHQIDSEGHEACLPVQLNSTTLTINRDRKKLCLTINVANKDNKFDLNFIQDKDYDLLGNPKKYWIKQYLSHESIDAEEPEYIFVEFTYYNLIDYPISKEVIKIPKKDFKKCNNYYVAFDGSRYYFINPKLIHKRGNKIIKYKIIYG